MTYRVMEYAGLFAAVVLLQVFLFDNLSVSVYFNPLVYVAFILLLPMEIAPGLLLLLGLLTGVTIDAFSGAGGVNTVATLALAYLRPGLLTLLVGKENVKDGGMPLPGRLGKGKFLRYVAAGCLLQCLVLFTLEALGWRYIGPVLLRAAWSTVGMVAAVWLASWTFNALYRRREPL